MPNSPDRNYNTAAIMHDETHDGIGSSFPWTKVTLSSADGYGLVFAADNVTTGKYLTIDGDALTTGSLAEFVSNSSETDARSLVLIHNDNTAATGCVPLTITQDAESTTHFNKIISLSGVMLYISDGTTANGALSGTAGDICFNAGSNKPEYCTGTTNWTALV